MYTQNQEEKYILEYFQGVIGTFMDIGANDGVKFSNTRALAEAGWAGIVVEPSQDAFLKLKSLYRSNDKVYAYNFAIGESNDVAEIYEAGSLLGEGDTNLVSTCFYDETSRWPNVEFKKKIVKCFYWKTFVNRLKYKTFDFISIDTEGMDLIILKQIDLKDTKMVCVEWNGNEALKNEFASYCKDFKIIYESPENLLFAR